MDRTTPWWNATAILTISLPFAVLPANGNGADDEQEVCAYYQPLHHYENSANIFAEEADVLPSASMRDSADEIEYVQSVLSLTTTDLAKCLGVTRQTLYLWKSGAEIKAENAKKLESIKRAADVIASVQFKLPPLALGRKLSGGKSLSDHIAAGADGDKAANELIEMLTRENDQRELLRKKFANRKLG
jgi:DNA-binding XRE family transcriptional regulator